MKTICPYCRQRYEVDDEFELQEGICERCGKRFIIQREEPTTISAVDIISPDDDFIFIDGGMGNALAAFPQCVIFYKQYATAEEEKQKISFFDIISLQLDETGDNGALKLIHHASSESGDNPNGHSSTATILFRRGRQQILLARAVKDYIQQYFPQCLIEHIQAEDGELELGQKADHELMLECKKLKLENENLIAVNEKKAKELRKLKTQNETLKLKDEELKTENDALKLKNGELKTENDSLKNANNVLEKERDEVRDKLVSEYMNYNDLKDECNRLKEEQAQSLPLKSFDCITNSKGLEINICDRTERDWEKSPYGLIKIISESIPEGLIPPSGFPNFYLSNTLLHSFAIKNEGNESNFDIEEQEEFISWSNTNSWAFIAYEKPNSNIFLALGERLDKKAAYSVPIEFTILEMIGLGWQYSNGYQNNNEMFNEYTCFCFLNYIQNNPAGYYQPFSVEFIQQKQKEAQSYLQSKHYFKWPDTVIAPRSLTGTPVDERSWPQKGMLKYKGYSVGSSSNVTCWKRQIILREVYENQLPNVMDSDYMAQWGRPQSAKRLKKMAESLAAFAKNAKRKRSQGNFDVAIADWEEDLAWLKKEFYDGVYSKVFSWPNLKV